MTVAIFFLLIIYQSYSQCTLEGFNFQPISNSSFSSPWLPPKATQNQTISFAPCSSGIPSGCGSSGPPLNQCEGIPGCCAVCQSWNEETTGSIGACLGLSSNLQMISQVSSNQVKITYGKGDLVQTTPRQVDIYITCDTSAGILSFANFTEPIPSNPPPPAYVYTLNLTSSAICSGSGPCFLQGYHFNYISAFNNWSSSWTPPSSATPETISYAPCSSGVPNGCGTAGFPMNQCTNKSDCCAVCQSWIEETTGSQGACLGLSNKLMEITALSNWGVILTYGGGDNVVTTERRVNVMILCDPRSTLLTFEDFIPPNPQNPPPPFYEYLLVLSSSDLCGASDVEEFMEKIKKFL
jgi:hypothetical protein